MSHRLILLVECDSEEDLEKCKRAIDRAELDEYGTQARICGLTRTIRTQDIQKLADGFLEL